MALSKSSYGQVGTPRVYVDFIQYAKAIGYVKDYDNIFMDTPEVGSPYDFDPTNQHTYTAIDTSQDSSNGGHREITDLGFNVRFKNYGLGQPNMVWGHFLQGINYFGALGHNWETAAGGKLSGIDMLCFGKDSESNFYYADPNEGLFEDIVGSNRNTGNGYTLIGLKEGAWDDLVDEPNAWEGVKIKLMSDEGWVNGDQVLLGTCTVGRYMDFPVSPDLNVSMSYIYDGVDTKNTIGGSTITNINFARQPDWGIFSPWTHVLGSDNPDWHKEFDSRQTRQNGRRSWELSFSYIDKTRMFPKWSEYTMAALYDTDDVAGEADTFGQSGTTIYESIVGFFLTFTLGGKIPFIFQPNKDNQEFAICIISDDSLNIEQVAHGTYSVSMTFTEVW